MCCYSVKFLSQLFCLSIISESKTKTLKNWTEALLAFSSMLAHLHKPELQLLILLHLKLGSLGSWLSNVSW